MRSEKNIVPFFREYNFLKTCEFYFWDKQNTALFLLGEELQFHFVCIFCLFDIITELLIKCCIQKWERNPLCFRRNVRLITRYKLFLLVENGLAFNFVSHLYSNRKYPIEINFSRESQRRGSNINEHKIRLPYNTIAVPWPLKKKQLLR